MHDGVRPTIDLCDPEFYRSGGMHEAFTWMRAHEPVYRDDANGLWAVTRHADLLDVERRNEVFVSGRGYRRHWEPTENNMIASDDPVHQEQRRLVSRGFTPKAVRRHEDELLALVDELLEPIDGPVEVVDALAAQLPARMTARLLGFAEEDWRQVKSWSERLMRLDAQFEDPQIEFDVGLACMEFNMQLMEMVPDRKACPRDDLVSAWANAYEHDKVFNETGLFIAGGAETTRTAIAHGLRAFADHPDQWDLVAERPELVPSAVDEVIRWVTPLNNFFRTAVEDARIGEQPVAEGDRIILLYPSANRDEAVFADPFTFDVTRRPNPHVAFGYGTHFCIGANFAKYELGLLFGELTRRYQPPEVVTEPDVEPNMFARAVRSFEVDLTRR
ncbi:MAG TPA: cytochrome P450 [Acidimicrobiales bacterium]|nr:cytochrome P450 [Acidimicrobiales bacterium]